jgi:hypothetical protein
MNDTNRIGIPFKICPKCGIQWSTREKLLEDPELALVGYQANFRAIEAGILLFNHTCRTTLALPASDFQDLYNGPVFVERATGSSECGGHCLHQNDLGPCPARCECAYVRHILQLIKGWPKAQSGGRFKMQSQR